MDGSVGRTLTIRTAHTFSLMPRLLLLSADFASHPLWVGPGECSVPPVGRGFPLVVSTDLGENQPVTHVSRLVRHEAHGRDAVSLV
jgi:hypothetical protein